MLFFRPFAGDPRIHGQGRQIGIERGAAAAGGRIGAKCRLHDDAGAAADADRRPRHGNAATVCGRLRGCARLCAEYAVPGIRRHVNDVSGPGGGGRATERVCGMKMCSSNIRYQYWEGVAGQPAPIPFSR